MTEYRGKHHRPSDRKPMVSNSPDFFESSAFFEQSSPSRRIEQAAVKPLDDVIMKPYRSKRKTILIVIVILLVIAGLIFGGLKVYETFFAPEKSTVEPGQQVTVEVKEGWSTTEITRELRNKGVISNESDFKNAVARHYAESSLKPGTYHLTTGMDIDELVTVLVAGPVSTASHLTIPEGYTVEQTAQAVEQACGIPASEFITLAHSASSYVADYPFLKDAYNNSLEGFLYPKTYEIPQGASADFVIRTLLNQFKTETAQLDMSYATAHNLSYYDVITIASLIEKETAASSERPLVSSVIYNRLHKGMRLQIDATVVYALGPTYDNHPLLYTDLEVESPYNTYKVDQLPAGPICSPQIASIRAAAQPTDTDYLYYVLTSKEGFHTFCKTSEEFEEAKARYNEIFGVK